jgi:signal transduction histidine kinase
VKHSRASSVRVKLRNDDRRLMIDIHDNGIGGASMSEGAGLRSLIDRVDALGGRLDIHSPRGRGTRVSVELPCA